MAQLKCLELFVYRGWIIGTPIEAVSAPARKRIVVIRNLDAGIDLNPYLREDGNVDYDGMDTVIPAKVILATNMFLTLFDESERLD